MQAAQSGISGGEGQSAGFFLLFDRGTRPTADGLQIALSTMLDVSISHRPDPAEIARSGLDWLELIQWGMTFDLSGFAPGRSVDAPEICYRYSCPADLEARDMDALALIAGPHIAGGANTLPVLRAMLDMVSRLADALPGVRAISWGPARTAIAVSLFARSVKDWLDGGPFPALGMVGFSAQTDGSLKSEGLNFLVGRELVIDAAIATDRVAATRLGARVVHELVSAGMFDSVEELATVEGQIVRLIKSSDGLTIRVIPM